MRLAPRSTLSIFAIEVDTEAVILPCISDGFDCGFTNKFRHGWLALDLELVMNPTHD
jgi:hypothetical protein